LLLTPKKKTLTFFVGVFLYISTVEEDRFTHELRRDGIRTAKMLKEKGIISPSLVGAVKINYNTWVVPKRKKK
jgi:hypothetical protein